MYKRDDAYRQKDVTGIHSGKLPYLLVSALMLGAATASSCNEPVAVQRETSRPVVKTVAEQTPREHYRLMGMQAQLPDGWTVMPDIERRDGKVIAANNFQSKYIHGGILPAGGAEITLVADASIDVPSIDRLVSDFIDGDRNVKRQEIIIKGTSCSATQVESESEFTPNLTYKRVAVFLPLKHPPNFNPVIYKAFMDYNAAEDQKTQQSFNDTFSRLLESLVIVESAECDVRIRV